MHLWKFNLNNLFVPVQKSTCASRVKLQQNFNDKAYTCTNNGSS